MQTVLNINSKPYTITAPATVRVTVSVTFTVTFVVIHKVQCNVRKCSHLYEAEELPTHTHPHIRIHTWPYKLNCHMPFGFCG